MLLKAVYGLVDAPREWWLCLDGHFVESGWLGIGMEPCCWRLYEDGKLVAMAICHVDDLLISGKEDSEAFRKACASLKERFKWGAWEHTQFLQCGLEYTQFEDGHIELNCKAAVERIELIPCGRIARRPLTDREKTSCRAALGSLQYVATQLLYWICGEVSLLQGRINAAETDLLSEINKLIRFAQESCEVPLRYYAIEGETCVCAWTDGSWAARVDGRSQGAMLVGFVSEAFMRGEWGRVSVASFGSRKLPRVARSSLAMECQAMVLGQEESEYLRASWSWLHRADQPSYNEYASLAARTPGCVVTDSKGLYDSLARSTSSALGLNDRRTAIEALALRQSMNETQTTVRWVHSEAMVCDSMTKVNSAVARETTMSFATRPLWRLIHDESFTAAKRRKHLGRLDAVPEEEATPFTGPPAVPEFLDTDEALFSDATFGKADAVLELFAKLQRLLSETLLF